MDIDLPQGVEPGGSSQTRPFTQGADGPVGVEMRLWDGPAPNVPETVAPEVLREDGRVANVSIPTLTAYLPAKNVANGAAIVMCSGGGYAQLNLRKYAGLGTEAFSPRGIAVFNLKYRLSPPSRNARADALADGKRAMRLIRWRAAEWGIDPDRIGIIGASAGANIILNLMSDADPGQLGSPDVVERQSCRPNFAVLLSAWSGNQAINDFRFGEETPLYILHAEDDETAKVEFAREVEAAAIAAGAAVHAKYFPTGGHDAFGGLHKPYAHGEWPKAFLDWLETQGLLPLAIP